MPLVHGSSRPVRTIDTNVQTLRTLDHKLRRFERGQDIVRGGGRTSSAFIVTEGWACSYKTLATDRRQITSFYLPGDLLSANLFSHGRADYAVECLTSVAAMEFAASDFDLSSPGSSACLVQTLACKMQLAMSIQSEWIVNLGQRSAAERLGHLLCEIFHRLRKAGLTDRDQCSIPLRQSHLAEATGISLVHVNRLIKSLRSAGLIVSRGRYLAIPDLSALEAASLFSADYLDDRAFDGSSRAASA